MNDAIASGKKNSIRIDVGSNPELKDYFSRKPDGEKCELEIVMIKEGMTGDAVEGSVIAIAPEDYEVPGSAEGPPGEVKPDGEEPVMVLVGGK